MTRNRTRVSPFYANRKERNRFFLSFFERSNEKFVEISDRNTSWMVFGVIQRSTRIRGDVEFAREQTGNGITLRNSGKTFVKMQRGYVTLITTLGTSVSSTKED